jgi:hypothetical protein
MRKSLPASPWRSTWSSCQDTEFESIEFGAGTVIISRVPQSIAVRRRVDIWFGALSTFATKTPTGQLFDLLPTGEIVGWKIRPLNPPP